MDLHSSVSHETEEIGSWRCGEPWRHPVPNVNHHWEKCHNIVQQHDEEMCKAWKGEVDNLLIFAGLFSATVTAFTIDSYKWLDGTVDGQLSQLQQINNSTSPSISVSAASIRVNIFWFLSLTLCMATAMIGISCMQWLREFQRDAVRSHKDAVAMRQMRMQGLVQWKVPEILSMLPLLLQLALVLFFAGILDLLWSKNRVVASCITVATGIVVIFLLITIALPALQSVLTKDPHLRVGQCPYKSPQSWAFYRLTLAILLVFRYIHSRWIGMKAFFVKQTPSEVQELVEMIVPDTSPPYFGRFAEAEHDTNWVDYDIRWRCLRDATSFFDDNTAYPFELQDGDDILSGLTWIDRTFTEDIEAVHLLFHCLSDLETPHAAQIVSNLHPSVAYLPKLLFPPVDPDTTLPFPLYDVSPSPAADIQRREHVFTVFLWWHKHVHPCLNIYYLERIIRLMNTNGHCVPFIPLRETDQDLRGLSDDLLLQLFSSFRLVVTRNHQGVPIPLSIPHASEIWGLLRDLYSPKFVITDQLRLLTFDILEGFQGWARLSDEMQALRMEVCVSGMIRVFCVIDERRVATLRQLPAFQKVRKLATSLDEYMASQSASRTLRGLGKRRWPELMKKISPCIGPEEELGYVGHGNADAQTRDIRVSLQNG